MMANYIRQTSGKWSRGERYDDNQQNPSNHDGGTIQLPLTAIITNTMASETKQESSQVIDHFALIGLGAIGISFAALYLRYTNACVSVFDTRPDLEDHILAILPGYIDSDDPQLGVRQLRDSGRLRICSSVEEVCRDAGVVQEQGPEKLEFKRPIWQKIEKAAPPHAHFWSSTSGIAASLQNQDMIDKTRLLVVHPFNPPHILPLIEIVPSKDTSQDEITFVKDFFGNLGSGHRPVVIHKEVPGFVGNRLAFTLLREACSLVNQGVVSAEDLDAIVEASVGPRWAVQGPFKSYNMGGGTAGIRAFLDNLSGSVQTVWDTSVPVNFVASESQNPGEPKGSTETSWRDKVIEQTHEAYGFPTPEQFSLRDAKLKRVLEVQKQDQ